MPGVSVNRFRGSLLGALLGDCIGATFEGQISPVSKESIKQAEITGGLLEFTDDTLMAKAIGESIVANQRLNVVDIASRFSIDYFREMAVQNRGYSSKVEPIFRVWRECGASLSVQTNGFLANLFSPATLQFDGKGSIGNGGAMRIAPLALVSHRLTDAQFSDVITSVTLLTHAHPHAVIGTILLAVGIQDLLLNRPVSGIVGYADWLTSLGRLAYQMQTVDGIHTTLEKWPSQATAESTWQRKLTAAAEKLRGCSTVKDVMNSLSDYTWVTENLGNGVRAIDSVPTALFVAACHLAESDEIIETESGRWRVHEGCISAVHLGGDTDTIASMTGALLGASLGWPNSDSNTSARLPHLEGMDTTLKLADRLFEFATQEDVVETLAKPAQEVLKSLPRVKIGQT